MRASPWPRSTRSTTSSTCIGYGLPRAEGHRQGVESVRRTVKAALELGITHLTLFSFSSENWSRPKQEIHDLFGLMRRFVRRDLADLHKNGVKIRIIGTRIGLDDDILRLIDDAAAVTAAVRQGRGVMPAGIVSGQDEADVVAYVVSISAS